MLVKGINYTNLREIGDPISQAYHYYKTGADELIFLNIEHSFKAKRKLIKIIKAISRNVFIPFSVGGGVKSISDIEELLNAGADKVSICSSALESPNLIYEAAKIFGSQCIVLSIDSKKHDNKWFAYSHGGRKKTSKDVIEWALLAEELGAGEIILNSIDKDGTLNGFDIKLAKIISHNLKIPIIASGGAGNINHIYDMFRLSDSDAVLLASILHLRKYSISDIKNFLKRKKLIIR